jgi:hypothetical protein
MANELSKTIKVNFAANKPIFSWESPEFVKYQRNKKWFFYLCVVAIILIGVFLIMHLWSGAVLIFVAAVVFATLSGTKPKNISCTIYNEGVVVSEKIYPFTQFKSFWLGGAGELPKVYLQLTGRLAGQVVMPAEDQDMEQIRLFLSRHVPEEEGRVDEFSEIINRIFRF